MNVIGGTQKFLAKLSIVYVIEVQNFICVLNHHHSRVRFGVGQRGVRIVNRTREFHSYGVVRAVKDAGE